MSKPPKKLKPEDIEIETEPDAWERFEQAVDVLAHTPPKPRVSKAKKQGDARRQTKRLAKR